MKRQYAVPAVDRAMTILELLTGHAEGLSMIEIAERVQVPNNSVFRIAMTLCERGYLERSAKTKRFRLTRKFLALAFPAVHCRNIVELSLPAMQQLRDTIKESVLLAVRTEAEGVVLAQIPSPHPIRLMVEPGTRFELHSSGPGKVMLAFLPDDVRKQLLGTLTLTAHTSRTITGIKRLVKELDQVRHCGYAVDRGESFAGVHCVAAPIFDEHGQLLASIWASGPSTRLPEATFSQWGPVVVEHAQQVSQRLGYFAGPASKQVEQN